MSKKHTSKFLMVLLAICLITSIVLFAACNPDDNGGNGDGTSNEPYEQFTTTMFNEVLANLGSSFEAGQTFGIDIAASVNVDDRTEKNADVRYNLVAKGNIDVKSTDTEKASNLFLELVEDKGGNKRTIFGVGYEYIDGSPFLFVNVLDSKYHKVTGYSALSLYSILSGIDLSSISSIGGINLSSVLAQLLFGETGTIDGETYIFNFDLANVFGTVEKFLPLLSSFIGISTSDLDSVVGMIFGGVTYEKDGQTVSVTTIAALGEYIKTSMGFKGTVSFKFDNKKFVSANASFDYSKGGSVVTNYAINVEKALIGATSTPVNTFATFPMDAAARAAAKSTNLLNFQINGQAIGYGSSGAVKKRYEASLNMDIDPFVLLDLLQADAPSIPDVLKGLGYFNLTVDAYEANGNSAGNVLTIHSKFEEGFVVVNFDLHDAPGHPLAVGGVYEFEALVDVIGLLMNPSSSGEADGETESTGDEGGLDIFGIIGNIFGVIEYEDITNNGLTVDVLDLRVYVLKMLGMADDNLLMTAANFIFDNAATMNFKVFDTTFGACEYVETSTIENTMRKVAGFENKDFIKEVTAITELRPIEQGSADLNLYVGDTFELGKFFKVDGKNLKGETVTSTGYIMWSNLDTSYAGDQEVTFYIGIGHEIYSTIASMGLDDLIPLYGALKFTTTVTVLPYDANNNVHININDTRHFLASAFISKGATLFDSLMPSGKKKLDFTIGSDDNARTYALDSSCMTVYDLNGTEVTDKVLKDGKLKKAGNYKVRFAHLGYSAEISITADALYAIFADGREIPDTLTLGTDFLMDFKIVEELANGTKTMAEYTNFTNTAFSMKVGPSVMPKSYFADTTDYPAQKGKTYTFLKSGNLLSNTTVLITFTNFEAPTLGKNTIVMESKLVPPANTPESALKKETLILYPGVNANGLYSFMQNEEKYFVNYNNATSSWYAVTEEGKVYVHDLSIDIYYTLDGVNVPIVLNENGVIINLPNANVAGSRSTKIYIDMLANGIKYTANTDAHELSASNATIKMNEYLNGKISRTGNIVYILDEEVQTLEFKYSAAQGKYGIFIKNTDTLVYEVGMQIEDADGNAVTLADGLFQNIGKYTVSYTINIDGQVAKFFHAVTVNPAPEQN